MGTPGHSYFCLGDWGFNMSFNVGQFCDWILTPILKDYELYSPSAVALLLGTAAQESQFGTYLHQVKGPALGIYQMEPATHADIWKNFVLYQHPLLEKITDDFGPFEDASKVFLVGNLWYATLFARLHYLRVSEALPAADDISGLAHYWKKYYNTQKGAGTEEEFMANFKKYIKDKS